MPSYTNAFVELLRKKPYEIPKEESKRFYRETVGTPIDKQFFKILQKYTPGLLATTEKLVNKFFELADKNIDFLAFPKTEITLKILHEAGLVFFISTACGQKIAEKKLRKCNLSDYFKLTLGSDKIMKSSAHLEEFRKSLNISRNEFSQNTFLVGDSLIDMKIAKEYSIYAIGITNTLDAAELKVAGADVVISSIEELLKIEF